jgi:hypothetical protein
MATTRPQRQQPPVQAAVVEPKDPWQMPSVEVAFEQLPNSKWTANRSVKFASIDLEDEQTVTEMHDILERLDTVIRDHMELLYQRDAAAREEYFRTKAAREQNGGWS